MTWEPCGYFKHRLVDVSGRVVGRVSRNHHNHEWEAETGVVIGSYVSEEQAKAAVEQAMCATSAGISK